MLKAIKRFFGKQEEKPVFASLKPKGHTIIRHLRPHPVTGEFVEVDRREIWDRCVTDAFVAALVIALTTSGEINTYKYHDYGTGTTGEDATNVGLQTACGEARTTGTQVQGDSSNIYKTVAEHTFAGTFAITESGVFSAASGGTLMDRTVFDSVGVVSGEKIESEYQLTLPSGG